MHVEFQDGESNRQECKLLVCHCSHAEPVAGQTVDWLERMATRLHSLERKSLLADCYTSSMWSVDQR